MTAASVIVLILRLCKPLQYLPVRSNVAERTPLAGVLSCPCVTEVYCKGLPVGLIGDEQWIFMGSPDWRRLRLAERAFIWSLLKSKPQERATALDIVQNPWMQSGGIDRDLLHLSIGQDMVSSHVSSCLSAAIELSFFQETLLLPQPAQPSTRAPLPAN